MKTTSLLIAAVLTLIGITFAAQPDVNAVRPYPLQKCLVSDEALGSMGKPIRIVHQGQEVKFCCKPCVRKFKKDPASYLAKLNQ